MTALSVVAAAALCLTGTSAADAASRASLHGSVPSWAVRSNDVGAAPTDQTVEGEIFVPLKNQAGAEKLARDVSTPGSKKFHHYPSAAQWISSYAPSKATLREVTRFLQAAGFTITGVPKSREYVVFRGPVAAADAAFATSLHHFSYRGHTLTAPSSVPSVPTALRDKVAGVSLSGAKGLRRPANVVRPTAKAVHHAAVSAKAARAADLPTEDVCSQYFGEHTVQVPPGWGKDSYSTDNCGYTPKQTRAIYGLNSSNNRGKGQTVAITDAYASPTIVQDVNTYSDGQGEPRLTSSTYSQIVPSPSSFTDQDICEQPSGWQAEQTLDVEAVHAVAPKAHILYVGGFNCLGGLDLALSNIIDNNRATIITNSWGELGEDLSMAESVYEITQTLQAAGEGIGTYFSSGDSGDESVNLGRTAVDLPASSPWAIAVGGTSVAVGADDKVQFTTGWGNNLDPIVADASGALSYGLPLPGVFYAGAGGGRSSIFDEPSWQRGVVPSSVAQGRRAVPDIAALADPFTGFLIGIRPIVDDSTLATGDYQQFPIGGTSLASPITAAEVAIVQASTRTTLGFANPVLYKAKQKLSAAFTDPVPQSPRQAVVYTSVADDGTPTTFLVTLDTDSSLLSRRGWDEVTGLGSLTFKQLLKSASIGR